MAACPAFPASALAVGAACLAAVVGVVASAAASQQRMARGGRCASAAAPAGSRRQGRARRGLDGRARLRDRRACARRSQLAPGRTAAVASADATGDRTGPFQQQHRVRPAAIAPAAGAGQARDPAARTRGWAGRAGRLCGRGFHRRAVDRRCGQRRPVPGCAGAGGDAGGRTTGRSRHRLVGASAATGGIRAWRHPGIERSRRCRGR